jgi:hypothetical protein
VRGRPEFDKGWLGTGALVLCEHRYSRGEAIQGRPDGRDGQRTDDGAFLREHRRQSVAGRRLRPGPAGRQQAWLGAATFTAAQRAGPAASGSALAGHMGRGKAIRWHIDRLTEAGIGLGALVFPDADECELASAGPVSANCRLRQHRLRPMPQPPPATARYGRGQALHSGL